ncbi:hypothetical protein [Burkholderia phage vB_BglM_WTB]
MAKASNAAENAVVEVKNGALVAADFMMEDFGAGFEGAGQDAYAIPFIQILQKMSPKVDEDAAEYIPGAKAGMFYNTVTQKLYDGKKGLLIIPCGFKQSFILWGGNRGGFKGEVAPEVVAGLEKEKKVINSDGRVFVLDENGAFDKDTSDYYLDTRSHFVIVLDEESGEYGTAIVSAASSQIKASKMLMTSLQQKKIKNPRTGAMQTPAAFANLVRMTTVGKSNEKGNWSGLSFALEGLVTDPALYAAAKELNGLVASGEAKADYAKADADSAGAAAAGDTPKEAEGF